MPAFLLVSFLPELEEDGINVSSVFCVRRTVHSTFHIAFGSLVAMQTTLLCPPASVIN